MTQASKTTRTRRGLTLVELLVTISIIALLVGLITVGYTTIIGNAQRGATTSLVNTLGQGVESFRADFGGRTPPLITRPPRGGGGSFGNTASQAIFTPAMFDEADDRAMEFREARYHSQWTLGIYLLGNSDLYGDGMLTYSQPGSPEPNRDDGLDGPGYRDPGELLAWKRRDRSSGGQWIHDPAQTGRTYGPYVEPGIEEFVETVDLGGALVQRFVDPFGNPVRYYQGYPTKDRDKPESNALYMPIELFSAEAAREYWGDTPGLDQSNGDVVRKYSGLNREVLNAEYVILAAGADPADFVAGSGEQVRPYGDVTILGSGETRTLPLGGTAQNPQPFAQAQLNDPGRNAAETWARMIESNVRFTP